MRFSLSLFFFKISGFCWRTHLQGWGCAYRSLQTMVSWLKEQGFIQGSIPTHQDIKRWLVQLGSKPPGFLHSNDWIGALEVMEVLNSQYGIECKILNINSGRDISAITSDLAQHFASVGCPVMIGSFDVYCDHYLCLNFDTQVAVFLPTHYWVCARLLPMKHIF